MSHTAVTVRTATVTRTSGSSIFLNTGYLTTFRGFLKVLETILGVIVVGIMGHHLDKHHYFVVGDQFLLLMATTFMIGTFLLLLSSFLSLTTETMLSKTLFEVIYHAVAFGLLLASSLNLLIKVTDNRRYSSEYELLLGASICGLINCALYFCSTVIAIRMYRGF
ncbi:uncharacterized protein [Chelonus insularis]|uniref:uncharacterized protein n=1 Tax=Chelonus insularis TaxID=460826 RepID=UPI001589236F|nr:uncharacterized protein LOC118064356 [Chelonus insularis]